MFRPLGSSAQPVRIRPARLVTLDVRRNARRESYR